MKNFLCPINPWLQTHVVSWTGFAMCVLHVYLGNLSVVAHHIQGTVPQQGLQGKDVAAGAQIGDGHGMPEFVRVSFFNPGSGTQAVDRSATFTKLSARVNCVPPPIKAGTPLGQKTVSSLKEIMATLPGRFFCNCVNSSSATS